MTDKQAAPPHNRTLTSERVFSGIQPSGLPHLGNYLGAFRNYIALQERGDTIYCIVDYHALTSTHDPELDPAEHPRHGASTMLALGLDPDKPILFRQSDRPEHAELAYLLSTVVPVAGSSARRRSRRRSAPSPTTSTTRC